MSQEIKYPEEIKMESARRAVEKMEKARTSAVDRARQEMNEILEKKRKIGRRFIDHDILNLPLHKD